MNDRLSVIKTLNTSEGKRYLKPLRYPVIPLKISDLYVITTSGDRLDSLAYRFYDDIRLWWIIATANRDIIRRDSYSLKPGLEIRIPQDIESVLNDYRSINETGYE